MRSPSLPYLVIVLLAAISQSKSLSIFERPLLSNRKIVAKIVSSTAIGLGILGGYTPSVNAIDALDAAMRNSAITYSNNAKNFERMGKGDFSQGSKDISQSPAALKRRAVKGCKTEKLRSISGFTEKECMNKAMNDDIQFMLDIYSTLQKSE